MVKPPTERHQIGLLIHLSTGSRLPQGDVTLPEVLFRDLAHQLRNGSQKYWLREEPHGNRDD